MNRIKFLKLVGLCFCFLVNTGILLSQSKSSKLGGFIEYDIYISGKESLDTVSNISNKKMLNRIKSILDTKTFTLTFNDNESLFMSKKVMEIKDNEDPLLKIASILSRDFKIYYRNNVKKQKLTQIEFSGEKIIIQDTINDSSWNLTSESKQILGYTCYRAFKEIKEYNPLKDVTRYFYPEVWYCPELNHSFGPIGLDGLPGLVLEATMNNKFIYRAKSIKLDKKDVSFPVLKGKKMSREEYNRFINEFRHN